jgi:hypothetical protein
MSLAMTKSVGKAKVNITATGCMACGTEHGTGWSIARQMPVTIGLKRGMVNIHICDECRKKKGKA